MIKCSAHDYKHSIHSHHKITEQIWTGSIANNGVWLCCVYEYNVKYKTHISLISFCSNRAYTESTTMCLFKRSYTYKWALMMGVYSHIHFISLAKYYHLLAGYCEPYLYIEYNVYFLGKTYGVINWIQNRSVF